MVYGKSFHNLTIEHPNHEPVEIHGSCRHLGAISSCKRRPIAAEQRQKEAHGVSRGLGELEIGAAKRRKTIRGILSPRTGLLADANFFPRLTPWATLFRHSVADSLRTHRPNSDLEPDDFRRGLPFTARLERSINSYNFQTLRPPGRFVGVLSA